MATDRNYLMVGLFVIVTALCAMFFTIWIIGKHDQSDYLLYRIRFAESVSGLDIGSPVKFRGVSVGKVKTIAIDPVDTRLIRVDVSIVKGTPIKTDTSASLKLQGVTGTVFVELSGSSPNAPDLVSRKNDNDEIPEIPAQSSSIDAILNQTPEILKKVTQIADRINQVLSIDNINSINGMLTHWAQISGALEAQTGQLAELLHHSNDVASDLDELIGESQDDVHNIARNLDQTSRQLTQLIAHINKQAGGQSQELYQLMDALKHASNDLSDLTRSLKEHPSHRLIPSSEKGIPAP